MPLGEHYTDVMKLGTEIHSSLRSIRTAYLAKYVSANPLHSSFRHPLSPFLPLLPFPFHFIYFFAKKWFSESGKLVMKAFDNIRQNVETEDTFVFVMIGTSALSPFTSFNLLITCSSLLFLFLFFFFLFFSSLFFSL